MDDFKKIIRARIDRFNRLWENAVGYSFEDEPKITQAKYETDMAVWQPKADEKARKCGFESMDTYIDMRFKSYDVSEKRFKINNDELNDWWSIRPQFPSPLYLYEMSVINEAERIAEFITNIADEWHATVRSVWEYFGKENGEYVDCFKFVENLKKEGYTGWDEGHSGNSGSESVLFANCLLFKPDFFPFLHGALANLVGDKGYYDDRNDIPKNF